jgi:hypothetical protein
VAHAVVEYSLIIQKEAVVHIQSNLTCESDIEVRETSTRSKTAACLHQVRTNPRIIIISLVFTLSDFLADTLVRTGGL